jgi:hypothetical protein
MKANIIIRTGDFEHIELKDVEGAPQDLVTTYHELKDLVNNEGGVSASEWKKIRTKMLKTGEFDPNTEGLSKAQLYWINQTKLAIRDIKNEQ